MRDAIKFIMLIAVFLFLGLNQAGSASGFPFSTDSVVFQHINIERQFDGVVEPVYQSTVSAQTAGQVIKLYFDVGEVVPKGEIIIRLNDTEHKAHVEQEIAALHDVRARQKEAQEEFQRVKDLATKKLSSPADLDRAEAELESWTARLQMAQARIVQAKEQLSYTVIKAPFSGVVVKRHVEIGESVIIGQALMTGFSLAPLRVVTNVPQDIVEDIRQRNVATILFDHERQSVDSQVLTVFPYANDASHTVKVRVGIPLETQGLYPGLLVKVAFALGSRQRLLVPFTTVVYRSEVTGVYVADEATHHVSLRYVLTGQRHGELIEILAGLDEGEQIAVDPLAAGIYLKEQQR